MLSTLLLAAAAAASAADPLVTFKDWTAGCDNGRSCMAVGQWSESNMELASVVVERGPLPGDVPKIWFRNEQSAIVDVAADGRRLGLKLVPDAEDWALTVDPGSTPAMLEALTSAKALVPVRSDGEPATPLSVNGAAAALRWIDAQQQRAGTVTALVAKGAQPASAVPAPPPLPVVRRALPKGAIGRKLTTAQIGEVQQRYSGCRDEADLQDKVDYGRIDERTTLALVTAVCASGAYNMDVTPLLLRDDGSRAVARFQGQAAEGDLVMNLSWNPATLTLSSSFKGRGIGDCGGGAEWVWDGAIFRKVGETMMGECLGAIAWIRTFRATAVPAPQP